MVNTVVLLTDSNDFEVVACLDIQAGTQLAWWYGPGYARGSEYRVPGGMEAYEQACSAGLAEGLELCLPTPEIRLFLDLLFI